MEIINACKAEFGKYNCAQFQDWDEQVNRARLLIKQWFKIKTKTINRCDYSYKIKHLFEKLHSQYSEEGNRNYYFIYYMSEYVTIAAFVLEGFIYVGNTDFKHTFYFNISKKDVKKLRLFVKEIF